MTASNRSFQWRDKVVEPLFESKPDQSIMAKFANKFGFADRFFRNIEMDDDETPNVEEHHPRIQPRHVDHRLYRPKPGAAENAHGQPAHLRPHDAAASGGPADGDYYGLPWPCWGTAEMNHPGTPNLYDMSKPVSEGGLTFRARFGVERDGDNLLAEGVYQQDRKFRTVTLNSPCRC